MNEQSLFIDSSSSNYRLVITAVKKFPSVKHLNEGMAIMSINRLLEWPLMIEIRFSLKIFQVNALCNHYKDEPILSETNLLIALLIVF